MKRQKRSLSLGARALAILSVQENASSYVEALITDHDAAWRSALDVLEQRGWERAGIAVECLRLGPTGAHCEPKASTVVEHQALLVLAGEWWNGNRLVMQALGDDDEVEDA